MPLTGKQIRFCDEYLVDLNASAAARRAGYSSKTANVIGHENLQKPEIKAHIEARLAELAISREETIKLISDIAKSSLNDYFIIKTEVQTPKVKKPLAFLISELHDQIADHQKLISRTTNNDLIADLHQTIADKQLQILKFEIEIERNPHAHRIVNGEPELIEVAELDVPKLVRDKERGKIKSIAPTEFGLKVELYAADAALRDMAKIHGVYAPVKAEVSGKDGKPIEHTYEITLKL